MEKDDAILVIGRLQKFYDDTEEIMSMISERKFLSPDEKLILQKKLSHLKDGLAFAAKTGKVVEDGLAQTDIEKYFYQPQMSQAIADLKIKINSDPIKPGWHSSLYGLQVTISDSLTQLKEKY